MDIKGIALRIGEEADEYADAKLQSKGEFHPDWHTVRDEYFAESIVAEIAKQNEPCAFLHEWIEYHPFGDTFAGEPCAAITNDEKPFDSSDTVSPLFTLSPTAEQIANETAEACAELAELMTARCAFQTVEHYKLASAISDEIRSGAWKEFKR